MLCLNCNKELVKHQTKYCCLDCQNEYIYKQYIDRWQNGLEDGMRGELQISNHIEKYLRNKFNNQCTQCGWHKINPYTNKIPLEVEHKDGNYKNNQEENLDLLCPSCHALTPTYKGANLNKGRSGRKKLLVTKKQYFCSSCSTKITKYSKSGLCLKCISLDKRTIQRPNREELKEMIRSFSFASIGNKYGVSDSAIKKWCLEKKLPNKKTEINSYSDEEWNLI